jgi:hypothetical protein
MVKYLMLAKNYSLRIVIKNSFSLLLHQDLSILTKYKVIKFFYFIYDVLIESFL